MHDRIMCTYSYIQIVACSFLVLVTKESFFNNEVGNLTYVYPIIHVRIDIALMCVCLIYK